jgi:hypothetical protein
VATDLAADVALRGLRLVGTSLPDALATPVVRDARRLMRASRTAGEVAPAVAWLVIARSATRGVVGTGR